MASATYLEKYLQLGLGIALTIGLVTPVVPAQKQDSAHLSLTSSAFGAGQGIPAVHTCDGRNLSPPLSWSGISPKAKSLALIMEDPDAPDPAAPQRIWVHWVLYNIPANTSGLTAGMLPAALPPGTLQGANDSKHVGYDGPCPPVGRHRYFFRLFALDLVLPDLGNPGKAKLEQAMQDHVIDQTELIGLYQHP